MMPSDEMFDDELDRQAREEDEQAERRAEIEEVLEALEPPSRRFPVLATTTITHLVWVYADSYGVEDHEDLVRCLNSDGDAHELTEHTDVLDADLEWRVPSEWESHYVGEMHRYPMPGCPAPDCRETLHHWPHQTRCYQHRQEEVVVKDA